MEELFGGKRAVETVWNYDGGTALASVACFNQATAVIEYDDV